MKQFISTRGNAAKLNFIEAMFKGLATDGGLYVPQEWPKISKEKWLSLQGASYKDIAYEIAINFIGNTVNADDLKKIINQATSKFPNEVTPIKTYANLNVVECFHGPTFAFKDVALQFLGQMFQHELENRQQEALLLGATSGDTGAAALAALEGKDNIRIAILHPLNRVSDLQRRQMTTIISDNVQNIAVEGSFDDCQRLIKMAFSDEKFYLVKKPSAVNSINWARIMAQITYYCVAGLRLGAPNKPFAVAVPTGNFGNVFAAYVAKQLGMPIEKFIIGSNSNDILPRTINSGIMEAKPVNATYSPAMDIQVSSNFERLLFEYSGRDGAKISQLMQEFTDLGKVKLPEQIHKALQQDFIGQSFQDEEILAGIKRFYQDNGVIIDPHSIIGIMASENAAANLPVVSIATAHPAKFPDTIHRAIGMYPNKPELFKQIENKKELFDIIPADFDEFKNILKF